MKKILIVGGTGFIGSHLINVLLKKKYKVSSISFKKRKISIKAKFFFLDLSKTIKKNIIKKISPNVIVYAASLDHFKAESKFNEGHKIGYLSLINLLKIFSNKKGLEKIIFLSTAQVYKNYCKANINSKSEVFPKNAYSLFHLQAENYLKFFSGKNKIKVSCLRISNGYGEPFMNSPSSWSVVINDLCLQAYNTNLIRINSNPNDYRNFIYVKDIVKEIIENIKQKKQNNFEIRNLGSKANIRIRKVAEIIKLKFKKLLKRDIKIILNRNKIKKIKIYNFKKDNLMEIKKLTSFNEGIENLIKYIHLKNGKV